MVVRCISAALLSLGLALSAGAQTLNVYGTTDSGCANPFPGQPVIVPVGAADFPVHICFDNGALTTAEPCINGDQEVCAWDLALSLTGGLTANTGLGLTGGQDPVVNLQPTSAQWNGGNPLVGETGPTLAGTIYLNSAGPGTADVSGKWVTGTLALGDAQPNTIAVSTDDWDEDGTPNASDNCPTISNVQTNDADGDGVGDECDICVDVYNPYVASPQPWMTLTNGQRDGNGDGNGNACDGKIIAGAAVGGGDTTEFRASFLVPIEDPGNPGQVNNACGTTGTRNCDQFDMDEVGASISGADTSAVRGRFLQEPGPNCGAACDGTGAGFAPVTVSGYITCTGPCCPTVMGDPASRPASCQP